MNSNLKKRIIAFLLTGISSGILAWILSEVFLIITNFAGLSFSRGGSILGGVLIGAGFGSLIVGIEGFYYSNRVQLKRGLKIGLLAGILGGGVGFAFSELLFLEIDLFGSLGKNEIFVFMQRWIILGAVLGLAIGIRDKKNTYLLRGLIGGALGGFIGGGIFQASLLWLSQVPVGKPVAFMSFGICLAVSLQLTLLMGRKTWLRILNGNLEGIEFELTEPIHFIGNFKSDDVLLHTYRGINQTHAKLERIEDDYALLDNDHFGRTYVNFRSVQEQPLKNGDIIKIGNALLQYCTKTPKINFNKKASVA